MLKFIERKQSVCVEDDRAVGNFSELSQNTKNIVIFGESGVGKSSLINLIAGERVSETSSGALGCTLEYQQHLLSLGDQHFTLWDTAGLDEGAQGSVPAEKAEAYLKQLLHKLTSHNGIDLLVYCVRGTRVRSALLTNYHIFYSAICRKKVPIAIVITGLENQEGDMETWWSNNKNQFSSLKMHFDSHVCVTTLAESVIETPILEERRKISKEAVMKMIASTCRTQRWKPPECSWIESAYSDIRAMLTPKDDCNTGRATIIMCETFRNCPNNRSTRKRSISFQNPVPFLFSLHSLSLRNPISISSDKSYSKLPFKVGVKRMPECLYHVYQVPRSHASPEGTDQETRKAMVVRRGADLLIFCVSMEETESKAARFQWEYFNLTYGGELSPQIVLVVGAPDQPSAEKWWENVIGRPLSRSDVVSYCPSAEVGTEVEVVRKQLQYLINDRCINCSKVTPIFRRSHFLDLPGLTTLWIKPEGIGKDRPPTPEQDILTKLGVWDEVPECSSPTSPVSPNSHPWHF